MPRSTSSVELINLSLVHLSTSLLEETRLGIVTVPQSLWHNLCLPNLREIITQQLPNVLPQTFIFCSKERHDILLGQESHILATQIADYSKTVRIRNSHDLPEVIIRNENTHNSCGHVLTAFNSTLDNLRQSVISSCCEVSVSKKIFEFLYTDGAAVPMDIESNTQVHECLRGHEIQIQFRDDVPEETQCKTLKRKSQLPLGHVRNKELRLSFTSSKDISRESNNDTPTVSKSLSDSKQLLISYVRAEAAEHALKLKRKLTANGFSVYLDVHEIKLGIDWQDALNYAVSNCEVFIPLVTPRYGETQWTNREVKLADVLGKPIFPVSFLGEWPPRCLAIQFATTQYIQWKTPGQIQKEIVSGKGDETHDIRHWDSKCVEAVAKEIEHRIKALKSGGLTMSKPALTRMKTLMKTFAGRLPETATPTLSTQESEEPAGPQIVICVHPQEAHHGFEMKRWLEEAGHSVWVSAFKGHYPKLNETDVITSSQDDSFGLKAESSNEIFSMASNITIEQVAEFQEAVDRATLVIVILTKVFSQSKICRGELFYCEHRKQIIPVAYQDFKVPCWLKVLIRAQKLVHVNKPNFRKSLLMQVKRALDPTAKTSLEPESQEANIGLAVQHLRNLLNVQQCVYVTGACKLTDISRTEAVCRSVARHLAQLEGIGLVTGGCYGVSELVGRTFAEESQRLSDTCSVWHVLPEQESQDVSEHYNQSSDGSFPLKDFGKTFYCGNSVWEKEAIVGRCFQICLLIDGKSDTAHEVEEFVWSDHIVVPVCCPRGVAVGDFRITDKLYQLPPGVSEQDWKCLNETTTDVEEIGQAVTNVISDLLKRQQHQDETSSKPMSIVSSSTSLVDLQDEESTISEDTSNTVVLSKSQSLVSSLRNQQTIVHPYSM